MSHEDKSLTDLLPELRRPFTVAAVKIKPQVVTKDQTKGLVTFYIDSRLLVERLNAVVGAGGWTDAYRLLAEGEFAVKYGLPIECALTVCGVTKVDVGQLVPGEMDDKAWKSAYSDAFKRAGVKFGVGAFLYNLPQVWAETKVGANGKAQGFSDVGARAARSAYEKWLKSPQNIYGDPLDHGDIHTEDIPEADVDRSRLDAVLEDLATLDAVTDFAAALDKAARKDYGRPVDGLGQDELDAISTRMEQYAATLRAANGSGEGEATLSGRDADPSVAPSSPEAISVGEPPQQGTDGTEPKEAGSGSPTGTFSAPTSPRGTRRKATA